MDCYWCDSEMVMEKREDKEVCLHCPECNEEVVCGQGWRAYGPTAPEFSTPERWDEDEAKRWLKWQHYLTNAFYILGSIPEREYEVFMTDTRKMFQKWLAWKKRGGTLNWIRNLFGIREQP